MRSWPPVDSPLETIRSDECRVPQGNKRVDGSLRARTLSTTEPARNARPRAVESARDDPLTHHSSSPPRHTRWRDAPRSSEAGREDIGTRCAQPPTPDFTLTARSLPRPSRPGNGEGVAHPARAQSCIDPCEKRVDSPPPAGNITHRKLPRALCSYARGPSEPPSSRCSPLRSPPCAPRRSRSRIRAGVAHGDVEACVARERPCADVTRTVTPTTL
jgi:hypothetical protein